MTKKLFWTEPYRCELATRVRAVEGTEVRLEESIFYAFSGGQESDAGSIGGRPVLAARKEGLDLVYQLPEGHGLQVGDNVEVRIDWERRYRLMRLHFAAELVLELVYREWGPIEKIGAHIAQEKARIDFARETAITAELPALQAQTNAMIEADLPIESAFLEEATQRRCWRIPGWAEVPCGGTHLRRSGEVGAVELKRKNIGKGKERIEIYLKN